MPNLHTIETMGFIQKWKNATNLSLHQSRQWIFQSESAVLDMGRGRGLVTTYFLSGIGVSHLLIAAIC